VQIWKAARAWRVFTGDRTLEIMTFAVRIAISQHSVATAMMRD